MGRGYSCLLSTALTGIQAQAGWAQLCRERQLWDASGIFLVTPLSLGAPSSSLCFLVLVGGGACSELGSHAVGTSTRHERFQPGRASPRHLPIPLLKDEIMPLWYHMMASRLPSPRRCQGRLLTVGLNDFPDCTYHPPLLAKERSLGVPASGNHWGAVSLAS